MEMVSFPTRSSSGGTGPTSGCRLTARTYRGRKSAPILRKMKEHRRGLSGRTVTDAVDARACLFQRRPAPGHQGRRPHRRPRRAAHSSTNRPRRRSPTVSTRRQAKTIAVYDLGGGTSTCRSSRVTAFEVKCTSATPISAATTSMPSSSNSAVDHFKKLTPLTLPTTARPAAPQGRRRTRQERAVVAVEHRRQPAIHHRRRRTEAPRQDDTRTSRTSRPDQRMRCALTPSRSWRQ